MNAGRMLIALCLLSLTPVLAGDAAAANKALVRAFVEGDRVAIWATYGGTQKGPLGPFPATGQRMAVDFGAVFRIEGGKIAELWLTWDNLTALSQLGLLPSFGGPPESRE